MTAPQVEALLADGAVAAVPVGAIEQHGAHLAVDTDSSNVTAVTVAAARRTRHPVIVAPTLPFGFSPYHRAFAGTISLSLSTYLAVLNDVCGNLAASGFQKIVLVNGHGGNSAPLRALTSGLVSNGLPVAAIDYWAPSEPRWQTMLNGPMRKLGHGCELETVLQLAIAGDAAAQDDILTAAEGLAVRMDAPWVEAGSNDPIIPYGAAWSPIFHQDDCGYTGDPASATVETGMRIFDVMADGLAAFFDAYAEARLKLGIGRTTPSS